MSPLTVSAERTTHTPLAVLSRGKWCLHHWQWQIYFYKITVYRYSRFQERGISVSIHKKNTADNLDFSPNQGEHEDAVAVDGLEHIFKWASETVSDPQDERVRQARDRRVRHQVLDVVQKYREQRVVTKSQDEVAYLQRRVIALLSKMQEMTEENAAVKQIMVSQFWAIQRIPVLEEQVRVLKVVEYEKEAAVKERRYLMDALAKIKVERDYLEDILVTCEDENTRLSSILNSTRAELAEVKARKWWHSFVPKSFLKKG